MCRSWRAHRRVAWDLEEDGGTVSKGRLGSLEEEGIWLAFERSMEEEATNAHDQIAAEGNQEDGVVLVLDAAPDALDSQPDE